MRQRERVWVGIDLGGTKLLTSVFASDFGEIARDKTHSRAEQGVEHGLRRIQRSVRRTLRKAGVDPEDVAGIGVGCAGPVRADGVLLEAPNMGWTNIPLKAYLESAFGCPVAVLNDVDAGVYGEYRFGAAQGARCAVGIFPGTGIGGGCVYEGRILRGASLSCFEIGHIPVLPGGPLCGCGQRGCLESVASRLFVSAEAAIAALRGQAPYLRGHGTLDLRKLRSGMLHDAIQAGDLTVEAVVRRAAEWVGVAAACVVNLLAPDVILLGGGLVEAMPKLFCQTVARTARQRVMRPFRNVFQVRVAALEDASVSLGAAAWARHTVEIQGDS